MFLELKHSISVMSMAHGIPNLKPPAQLKSACREIELAELEKLRRLLI